MNSKENVVYWEEKANDQKGRWHEQQIKGMRVNTNMEGNAKETPTDTTSTAVDRLAVSRHRVY